MCRLLPRVVERLRGRDMVRIEGGSQALRRTVNAVLDINSGERTVVSVPSPLGAVVLKAAAYTSDRRDHDRHLFDAVALLANIIAITPGTVVADIDDACTRILVHVLDLDDPGRLVAEIKHRYERPLKEIFGC